MLVLHVFGMVTKKYTDCCWYSMVKSHMQNRSYEVPYWPLA